ncbi:hypothetical protein FB446DRAFT_771456 [Lentinula raphanica]|nr:hypothetical protein FB446DRAFT_771456 [Lentinula raphanica]
MRLTTFLLLGLVSATYGLPNPGSGPSRFSSSKSRDSPTAVGHHESELPARDPNTAMDPLVVTFHVPEEEERSEAQAKMAEFPDFRARFTDWSQKFMRDSIFGKHGMDVDARYDTKFSVPIHSPWTWYILLTTKDAAIVIDKGTQKVLSLKSAAAAKRLSRSDYWVIPTPVTMDVSIAIPREVAVRFPNRDGFFPKDGPVVYIDLDSKQQEEDNEIFHAYWDIFGTTLGAWDPKIHGQAKISSGPVWEPESNDSV